MTGVNPLENLRDIHLPGEVSFWPLAPGWWILIVLTLTLICFVSWKIWQRYQQRYLLRLSLHNLTQLIEDYASHQDPQKLVKSYSSLLRRIAVAEYSRQKVAGLTGKSWLTFLDESAQTTIFNSEIGQLLINAPYQKHEVVVGNLDELTTAVKFWINNHRPLEENS